MKSTSQQNNTDPNPALTEALEAISWPVKYASNGRLYDNKGNYLGAIKSDALGHLIANNLNQLKRKG